MSRKYKFHNPEGVYFVSFAVQGWVDVFTRNKYKDIILESLKYCQAHKGLELFAYCLMTNHLHLMSRASGQYSHSEILRDFKKYTSKALIIAIKQHDGESRKQWLLQQFTTDRGYRFWRGDNKPIEVYSNHVISQKLRYIHQNPVEEGLVFRAEDYVYSSAVDYAGGKGLLNITKVDV